MPPDPIDSRTHRVLSGVSRVAVLEALRATPTPLDVLALADLVGLHANTVRSHLDQLVEAGLVATELQVRTTPGRPRLLFSAVAPPDEGHEDSYKVLAEILAEGIRAGEAAAGAVAARAGRRWGHQVERAEPGAGAPVGLGAAVDRIVALLDEIGFAPTIVEAPVVGTDPGIGATTASASDATVIELHRCPFIDVARAHTDVVCSVHLGLIQGALDEMHAPPATIRLEPFVRPDLCRVRLTPADALTATSGEVRA